MTYKWILGAMVLAAVGTAGAQGAAPAAQASSICIPIPILGITCPDPTPTTGDSVNIVTGGGSSSLTENITVSIPSIVAMHLHEKSWSLNLSDQAFVAANCYRAGGHNTDTGRDYTDNIADFMTHSGTSWTGDGVKDSKNAYSTVGTFTWASSYNGNMVAAPRYPGIEYTSGTSNQVSWKGPIVCFNRKVVEKFANGANGWEVNISARNVTAGFPTLVLGDRVANTGYKKVETLYNASNKTTKSLTFNNTNVTGMGMTTGGWLDDYILEALVFDGNETSGTKSADVVFQLTGKF
ncbi:hypothetical protein Dcar01_01509 [Deinococcus carri]|uniref:Uncharacterized protein n=1 Tax=Deinococcus carri TaxID=1211323 RepID=A0ABP9W7M0_9DEIO